MHPAPMLEHAFKEWAVICQALALGKQSILLRKGGIAEASGRFEVEHKRFWLYPTFTHQQESGIRPEATPFLEQVKLSRPPAGQVVLSHWAEVTGIFHIHDLLPAMLLAHLHWWSDATVEQRFHYRGPGLFVLAVRVYRAADAFTIVETAEQQGCKSWVALKEPRSTAGSTPVLEDHDFRDLEWNLETL